MSNTGLALSSTWSKTVSWKDKPVVFNQRGNGGVPLNTALPLAEVEHNPQTLLLLTSHGGHFGFLEGVVPRGETWMNRQFLSALKYYKE